MAGKIPRDFIDDLLSRTDVVEVVDSRVKLKKQVKTTKRAALFITKSRHLSLLVKTNSFTTVSAVALTVTQSRLLWNSTA